MVPVAVIGEAYVRLRPDGEDFEKDAKGILGKVAGTLAGVFAVQKVTGFLTDAVGAASDLGEATSKVGVVFGASQQKILDFSKTSATALGLSRNEALAATGTFGNLFTALGLTEGKSADMATELTTLAADLGSFNNVPVTDALDALRAGLAGEAEPLKRFGVNMNDATLKTKALSMGLIANDKEALSPAVKAQAAYGLILEQTSKAQGDFGRTSDGLANRTKILGSRFADFRTEMGEKLLPTINAVAGFLLDNLPGAFERVGTTLGPVFAAIGDAIGTVVTGIRTAIDVFQTVQELGDFEAHGPWEVLGVVIARVVDFVRETVPVIASVIGDVVGTVAPLLADTLGTAVNVAMALFRTFGPIVIEVAERAFGVLSVVVPVVVDVLGSIARVLPDVIAAFLGVVGAVGDFLGKLDFLLPIIGAVAALVAIGLIPTLVSLAVTAAATGATTVFWWVASQAGAIAAAISHGASIVTMIAGYAAMGLSALAGAAQVALAWIIALGPIALVIAAVVGLVYVIVRNFDTIKEVIAAVWEWLKGAASEAWDFVKGVISGVLDAVVGIIRGAFDLWVTIFVEFPMRAVKALASLAADLFGVFFRAIERAGDAVREGFLIVVEFFVDLPARVLRGLGNIGDLLFGTAGDLIGGLVRGIREGAGKVIGALKEFVLDKVPDAVKRFFGIDSPSRMFAGFGANLVDGLAVGIRGATGDVESAIDDLVRSSTPDLPALTIPVDVVSGASGGGALSGRAAGGLVSAPITISATFNGPTNADEVTAALSEVARTEVTAALTRVIASASAGTGRA